MTNVPGGSSGYLHRLFGLDGKVALVTGATGGIGQELALGLARAGARVVVSGRREELLAALRDRIAAHGGSAAVVPADLASLEESRRVVEEARAAFDGLDILVNCAGMNRREPIVEVTPETYDRIMAINLRAPYFASQAVAPHFIERGGGTIVNIGSLTSAIGLDSVSVYGATKAALAQLTKTQAVEWAVHNIRANCLCPGFIMTPLTEKGLWGDERKSRWILDRVPLKRPGRPEEMVAMTIFLASDASSYMTGQTVFLDGGLLAGSPW